MKNSLWNWCRTLNPLNAREREPRLQRCFPRDQTQPSTWFRNGMSEFTQEAGHATRKIDRPLRGTFSTLAHFS
ncbi:hypothetical protein CEXT_724131 [Caerostris extrusa]|uniref:Uncharacterized protein n=1 Tax=Caerostris extrusa TaxID=172846 RepID=A0AAV4QN26_CAEEX|nr:hypothetical protein CEXT_724131 [Caerostris extrusa]